MSVQSAKSGRGPFLIEEGWRETPLFVPEGVYTFLPHATAVFLGSTVRGREDIGLSGQWKANVIARHL